MQNGGMTRRRLVSGVIGLGAYSGSTSRAGAERIATPEQHAGALAEAMAAIHGGRWQAIVDHQAGFVIVRPVSRRRPESP